ncbi:MAG: site-specific integrase [Colwellia sp.]|nr:site-specific integrase [Colwellia sp.]
MTLIKQKSGIFQVRFMVDGKTYQKSSQSRNKAKAQQVERQYHQEILDKKLLGTKDSINLYNALDKFLTSKIDLKSYDDIANKVRGVKLYFDDKPIHELTTADVEHYVLTRRQEGRAPQTIEHGIIQLRGCIEYMERLDYQVPVIKFPKIKVQNQRIRMLSRDEEIRLLSELVPDNTKYYKKLTPFTDKPELMKQRQDNWDLVVMLLDIGARYSEIAELTWQQIDLKNKTILLKRSKTNNEAVLYMSNRVYQVLKSRNDKRVHQKWIFTDKSGQNPRKHSTIAIRRAIANAGIEDFRVHDFRHTCASRLVQNGMTIQEVGHILGHSPASSVMTMRYAHLEKNQVAEKMKAVIDRFND